MQSPNNIIGKEHGIGYFYLQYEFIDITGDFMSACAELTDSKYAMSNGFKLVDAMSAIELMDPKMDTGIQFFERNMDNFHLRIEELKALNYSDLIAIFDASFAMLISWLNAQPLDQTVYTNLCFYNPELLKELPHLYTISIIFLHLIKLFKLFIESASVYCEEDLSMAFIQQTAQFDVEDVRKNLRSSINALKNTELKNKACNNLSESKALRCRYEFFLDLFDLFNNLLFSSNSLLSQNSRTVQRFSPDFKRSSNCILDCIKLNKQIASTISLGTQPVKNILNDGDYSWLSVFDSNVYLYLSPTGFPRKPKLFSRTDSYKYFGNFLEDTLKIIQGAPKCIATIGEMMEFFQRYGDEKSCISTRSILQLIVMPNDHVIFGTIPLSDIVISSMNRSSGLIEGAGVEEMLKTIMAIDPAVHIILDEFISSLVRGYIGVFQTFGNNLARQYEKLLRTNFDDFAVLMTEANRIEAELELIQLKFSNDSSVFKQQQTIPSIQHIFSNYLLYTILDLMHYHFSLGFRLRLYSPFEYTYIYWYFGEIIAKSLTNLSEKICNTLIMEFSKNSIHSQKKISGKRLQIKNRMDNFFHKNLSRLKMDAIYYRIEIIMAQAMFKFTLGLIGLKKLGLPPRENGRYMKRIEPFINLPTMLYYSYDEYLRESRVAEILDRPFQVNFNDAALLFRQTISIVNDMEREGSENDLQTAVLLQIQQLAKQNLIVAKLLATEQLTKKIAFEFSSERLNFPVIKFYL